MFGFGLIGQLSCCAKYEGYAIEPSPRRLVKQILYGDEGAEETQRREEIGGERVDEVKERGEKGGRERGEKQGDGEKAASRGGKDIDGGQIEHETTVERAEKQTVQHMLQVYKEDIQCMREKMEALEVHNESLLTELHATRDIVAVQRKQLQAMVELKQEKSQLAREAAQLRQEVQKMTQLTADMAAKHKEDLDRYVEQLRVYQMQKEELERSLELANAEVSSATDKSVVSVNHKLVKYTPQAEHDYNDSIQKAGKKISAIMSTEQELNKLSELLHNIEVESLEHELKQSNAKREHQQWIHSKYYGYITTDLCIKFALIVALLFMLL